MSDVIDEVLDIRPGGPLDLLRRAREEARLRSQTSFAALFEPADFGPLSARERFAAAARVAEVSGADGLAGFYASARDRQQRRRFGAARRDPRSRRKSRAVARAPAGATISRGWRRRACRRRPS